MFHMSQMGIKRVPQKSLVVSSLGQQDAPPSDAHTLPSNPASAPSCPALVYVPSQLCFGLHICMLLCPCLGLHLFAFCLTPELALTPGMDQCTLYCEYHQCSRSVPPELALGGGVTHVRKASRPGKTVSLGQDPKAEGPE